jgi:hypothetical protein
MKWNRAQIRYMRKEKKRVEQFIESVTKIDLSLAVRRIY